MIVKVCGMRSPSNIMDVENAGADLIGFICHKASKRHVDKIPSYLPPQDMRVGVFVNDRLDEIARCAEVFGFSYLQLHGSETPALCRALHEKGYKIIKAFPVGELFNFKQISHYEPFCEYLLFDTPCASFGGSGKPFDWSILSRYEGDTPFLLSGGIGPGSIKHLAEFSHPSWAGIDLNSRFETAPAEKDAEALKKFISLFKKL